MNEKSIIDPTDTIGDDDNTNDLLKTGQDDEAEDLYKRDDPPLGGASEGIIKLGDDDGPEFVGDDDEVDAFMFDATPFFATLERRAKAIDGDGEGGTGKGITQCKVSSGIWPTGGGGENIDTGEVPWSPLAIPDFVAGFIDGRFHGYIDGSDFADPVNPGP